jgi:hypothetical protein
MFLAPRSSGRGYHQVALVKREGTISVAVYGDCDPVVVPPQGEDLASWKLDRAYPDPGPGATVLHVLIMELSCANGRPPVGRVLEPRIDYRAHSVAILITVRAISGDCPGNPWWPVTLTLDEALGDRTLLDGVSYPPAPVRRQ